MHPIVFIIWVASWVLLAIIALLPPLKLEWLGVALFDLWIGLQFLVETTDPFTF